MHHMITKHKISESFKFLLLTFFLSIITFSTNTFGKPNPYWIDCYINDSGQVAFEKKKANGDYTVIFYENGNFQLIGRDMSDIVLLFGLNNRGEVIIEAEIKKDRNGYIWKKGSYISLGNKENEDCHPTSINDSGDVTGYKMLLKNEYDEGFIWSDSQRIYINQPKKLTCQPYKINENDQVAGIAQTPEKTTYGFFFDDGNFINLGSLGGEKTWVNDLNNSGQVVGYSETGKDYDSHAFLWEDGVMYDLGTLGGKYSEAEKINDKGQIVGYSYFDNSYTPHAFLYKNGSMIDLGALGGNSSEAYYINDHGDIVGTSTATDGTDHVILWKNGVMIDLGKMPGFDKCSPYQINNHGQIVGMCYTDACHKGEIFLWENNTFLNLTKLSDKLDQ